MEKISKAQVKCIKTLVGKLKVADSDAMVLGFTNMRTTHVSEMSSHEGTAMIRHLASPAAPPKAAAAEQRMRRKLMALAYKYYGLGAHANGAQKADARRRLDEWCVQYSYAGKRLNDYTADELPKLISQYEIVVGKLLDEI